jgi:hypothetical protein
MARRRVISAELLVDPEYNSLSLEAQLLFLRMLCISDDCILKQQGPSGSLLREFRHGPGRYRDAVPTR